MFENLEPDVIPEPGPRELGAAKRRAAVRQRNMFLLGAGSGAGAVAVIALIVIALVTGGSNSKDINTVGRPDLTTTTTAAPPTTVAPAPQPPAAAPRSSGNARRPAAPSAAPQASATSASTPLIAFVTESSSTAFQVDVVNADGSGRRPLWRKQLDFGVGAQLGPWSPDGQLLAVTFHFSRLGGADWAVLLNREGKEVLKTENTSQSSLAWSADGSQFAMGGGCPDCAIPIYDTRTGAKTGTIDQIRADYLGFAWGPSHRPVAVESQDTSKPPVVVSIAPDNTDRRTLVVGDGTAAYQRQLSTGPGDRVYYFGKAGLSVVRDEEGAQPVVLSASALSPVAPSPDGTLVAFRSSASQRIEVMPTDGGPAKQVGDSSAACPAFTADGRLLFHGDGGIWVSDADGGNAKRLVAAPATACPVPSAKPQP